MARVITKKSTVPGKVPLAADLDIGELAVNTADAKLYTKHNDGSVKQLGGDAASGFFRTEPITATASGQTAFTVPGGYTPGAIFVSLNGASLPPADYAASTGTTVVLASGDGIVAGSVLLVHVLSAFEVADALPLFGTAADSERYAGLLPPPSDGQSYALKDGAWAEVQAGGGSWGSINGTLADQADLASALNSKAAASDIDFAIIYPNGGSEASPANVAASTRYINPNPFPGYHVLCIAEALINGKWAETGWFTPSNTAVYGAGIRAGMDGPADIVTQTGSYFYISGVLSGGSHSETSGSVSTTPPKCRVKVWKVKGAIA